MAIDPAFMMVMSKLRSGDQQAAAEVFRRFLNRLIALASHQFEDRLRSKADPEDVVQSVYKSFFRRDVRSPFELSDWEALWALLATITVRKCRDRRQFWKAARRDAGREAAGHDLEFEAWLEAIDREPTPLEATIVAETLERLIRPLNPQERTIAEMSFLQSYTAVEISERCECSERTVGRVLKRVRGKLGEIAATDSEG